LVFANGALGGAMIALTSTGGKSMVSFFSCDHAASEEAKQIKITVLFIL
jgi:hypothetical protein